jgi:hypothetical protein
VLEVPHSPHRFASPPLSRQKYRPLVAHVGGFLGVFSEALERAGKVATSWLRASDSKFDTHHDATLMVLTILTPQSVTPETAPLRKVGRSPLISAQVCVSLRSLGRTSAK